MCYIWWRKMYVSARIDPSNFLLDQMRQFDFTKVSDVIVGTGTIRRLIVYYNRLHMPNPNFYVLASTCSHTSCM